MITIKIQAGLGNQMFQYALGRRIIEKTGKNIRFELSYYANNLAKGDTVRELGIDKFNIMSDIERDYKATPLFFVYKEKILRKIFNTNAFTFYKKYLDPNKNSYLIGFWQSEKYFKDIENIIKKEFTLKDKIEERGENDIAKAYLEKINNSKVSISVNIRRGDYADNIKVRNYHGLIEKEYFINGVKYIKERLNIEKDVINIFIFSDDIEWCKENLNDLEYYGNLFFSSKEISATDTLYLISKCHHNVIANSSFSWWGAWLNQNENKIVVAPKYWVKVKIDTKDVVPEEWIELENRFY